MLFENSFGLCITRGSLLSAKDVYLLACLCWEGLLELKNIEVLGDFIFVREAENGLVFWRETDVDLEDFVWVKEVGLKKVNYDWVTSLYFIESNALY